MSEFKIDAPEFFTVSSFTPVEYDANSCRVQISGTNLDTISGGLIQTPDGEKHYVHIITKSEDSVSIDFEEVPLPQNTMFFVILTGEGGSWYPVGPMIKLKN